MTPGEILLEEFLRPMNISAYRLAKDTNIPATRVSQILKGNRKITADTALRFSRYFGNSADFWLGIQDEYDLRRGKKEIADELEKIPQIKVS
ncbi:MAG: HigA family addiction module antitoxin [Sediminispirochaetaceae bacterium]